VYPYVYMHIYLKPGTNASFEIYDTQVD